MNIVFFEAQNWETRSLKEGLKKHRIVFVKEPLTEKNVSLAKSAEIVGVFVESKVNKKILSKLSGTKLIVTRSTGYDHIDIKTCRKRRIKVCNVPSYGENTVAEHTFALILALSRKIYKSQLKIANKDYSLEGLKGFDLEDKTLGVIGVGKIGRHVIRIGRGFNMKVLAYDHHPDDFMAEQLNFRYVPFEDIIKKSDIITLHVPYIKQNRHLISKKIFKKMKKGAIIINTSRGEIIDTEALIWAIENKIVSAAGLDVIEGEGLLKNEKSLPHEMRKPEHLQQLAENHILLSKENVVYTPHMAFYSEEALNRIVKKTIQNIQDFERKETDGIQFIR